jgi:hypothetical protein
MLTIVNLMIHQWNFSKPASTGTKKYGRCNEVFEPGWKLTRGVIFQRWILRPEVLNLDPTPLRIEPGRGILIIYPVQNSTALKNVISTPMVYSIKNFISFLILPFGLFLLPLIHYVKNPKEFWPFIPPTGCVFQIVEKLKNSKKLKKCIHQV